jgi:transposase
VVEREPWPHPRIQEEGLLKVEDWAEIRALHRAEGLSIKEIARQLGIARNTVRTAIRSDAPPVFDRKPRPSAVDDFEGEIRKLLKAHPRMPVPVIAERIGWSRGLTILKDRVRELRPTYLPPDPCGRTTYLPGELAQWDLWFPPVNIPLGFGVEGSPPVVVGVPGYSRYIVAHMIPSRQTHDVLGGHLACLLDLGGVPRSGVYDNEPAIAHRKRGKAVLTAEFQAFRGTLGMGAIVCMPGDPEAKGLVERANGYLETSFLPGRTFADPADFNTQLKAWLTKANNRMHRRIGCRPSERIAEDRAAMLPLPPVLPDVAFRKTVRLPRDHWVRVGSCDYSVHPGAIGRLVEVACDLQRVTVRLGEQVVADHARSFVPHRTITCPEHDAVRKVITAFRATLLELEAEDDVEERDLASYDRALKVVL